MSTTATMPDVIEVESAETPAAKPPMVQSQQRTAISTTTPADLLRYALDSGADLDRLERLMALQQRWEEREAEKAFVVAMAEFKKHPPTIYKDKHVEFKTEKGITAYDHATLGNVVERVVAALAAHGFSHRWIPKRSEGGMISVTCVITHELGHSQETTLEAGLDQSGGKNNIQAMISTKSYLERHSLLSACGLATKDTPDDDGRVGGEMFEPASKGTNTRASCNSEQPIHRPEYDQAKFNKNKVEWKTIVTTGRKTPDGLIKFIESRGEPLSAAQKKEIKTWAKADGNQGAQ